MPSLSYFVRPRFLLTWRTAECRQNKNIPKAKLQNARTLTGNGSHSRVCLLLVIKIKTCTYQLCKLFGWYQHTNQPILIIGKTADNRLIVVASLLMMNVFVALCFWYCVHVCRCALCPCWLWLPCVMIDAGRSRWRCTSTMTRSWPCMACSSIMSSSRITRRTGSSLSYSMHSSLTK